MSRAFHYGPRMTFWEKVGDIDWLWLFFKIVMVAFVVFLGCVAYFVPPQIEKKAQEAEHAAIECAAQEGREPFRMSQFRVICIDKGSAKETSSQQG